MGKVRDIIANIERTLGDGDTTIPLIIGLANAASIAGIASVDGVAGGVGLTPLAIDIGNEAASSTFRALMSSAEGGCKEKLSELLGLDEGEDILNY